MDGSTGGVRRRTVAVLSAGLLLLGACGDDADNADGSTSTTAQQSETSSPTAPEGDSVRIGVLVNNTGQFLTGEQHSLAVLEGWEAAVNSEGGIAGHPVELVVEDSKGDPTTATAAADRLIGDADLDGLVIFDVQGEQFFTDALIDSGIPVIGGMGFMPTSWGVAPNWLPLSPSFVPLLNSSMVLADNLGATKTALVLCSEAPACAEAEPVTRAASEALGMEFAGITLISAAAPDYTGECLQLIDSGVDYIAAGASTMEATVRFVADCQQQGYTGRWGMFGNSIVADVIADNDSGATIDLALPAFPWFADDPAVDAYREMMTEQGVPEESWADLHGTAAYTTVELLRRALENAGPLPDEITQDVIVEAYGTLQDEDLGGLLAQPITFTPGEAQPLVRCYWFVRFEDDEFTGADLYNPVCDPPELANP